MTIKTPDFKHVDTGILLASMSCGQLQVSFHHTFALNLTRELQMASKIAGCTEIGSSHINRIYGKILSITSFRMELGVGWSYQVYKKDKSARLQRLVRRNYQRLSLVWC